jgi:hypothetical protein
MPATASAARFPVRRGLVRLGNWFLLGHFRWSMTCYPAKAMANYSQLRFNPNCETEFYASHQLKSFSGLDFGG